VRYLARIHVPLPAIVGAAILAVVLVLALLARLPLAERLPISPRIMIALALWLAWIAFLAALRDSSDSPGAYHDEEDQADGS
jgi:high-affinity Fe2+/Pb2+ permease